MTGWTPCAQAQAQEQGEAVKGACLFAHEHAQTARKASRFSEVRQHLRFCGEESCPALVRADCVTWLAELENVYPAVVFDAYVDGRQALDARVFVDGEPVANAIDGRSVPIDPGRHEVRIEAPGFPPNERTIVIPEGEHRLVSASFTHDQPKPPALGPFPGDSHPIPPSVWVAGGAAIVSAAVATLFGSLALTEGSSLRASCAPFCNGADLAPLRRDMLVTDVSLGVLAVSTIAAVVLLVAHPSVQRRTARGDLVGFRPSRGRGL